MKRRPSWLMRKMNAKKGKVRGGLTFNCQVLDDNNVIVERVTSSKPTGEALSLLQGLGIDLVSSKMATVNICIYYRLLEKMQNNKMVFGSLIPRRVVKLIRSIGNSQCSDSMDWDRIPRKIREAMFPFQKDGICMSIQKYGGRVLIADDMGLGKTIQAIGVAHYYKSNWPCLILCPSFLKLNWRKEFLQWTELTKEDIVLIKNGKQVIPKTAKIVIMSYGLLRNSILQLKHLNFKTIIADEAHYMKNRKAARTKYALELLHNAKTCILLTGTPMSNRPEECYTLVYALRPTYVGKWKEFVMRYCDAKHSLFGFDVSGKSNISELSYLLRKSCMIRRLKKNVLKDLPNKLRSQIIVQLTNAEMKHMQPLQKRMDVINKTIYGVPPESEECRDMIFERKAIICKLFHLNDTAKGKVVSEILMEQLTQVKKIVVFCFHMSMMDILDAKIKEKRISYMRIDGSTPTDKRQEYVDLFQNEDLDCRVALLSIGAANSGLTLTAAHTMLFASLHWVPSEICQAEDRCHRIGQKNAVDIRYVIARGTIDEKMFSKINHKLQVTNSILNSTDVTREDFHGEMNVFTRPSVPEQSAAESDVVATVQTGLNNSLDALRNLDEFFLY